MKKVFAIFAIIILFFLGLALWQLHNHTPTIPYTLIQSNHAFEIREYPSSVVVQTEVVGDKLLAINNGFAVLSSYIGGHNQTKEVLGMITPVILQSNNKEWTVMFFLPPTFTVATAPKPLVAHVHVRELPAAKYVVLQFTGFATDKQIEQHMQLLKDYVIYNDLKTRGEPMLAFYNPPWTLPFIRRNEIMWALR